MGGWIEREGGKLVKYNPSFLSGRSSWTHGGCIRGKGGRGAPGAVRRSWGQEARTSRELLLLRPPPTYNLFGCAPVAGPSKLFGCPARCGHGGLCVVGCGTVGVRSPSGRQGRQISAARREELLLCMSLTCSGGPPAQGCFVSIKPAVECLCLVEVGG